MTKNIAVIGSGVMGSNIALSFAVGGYHVTVNDIKEEFLTKAKSRIEENLSLLVEEDSLSEKSKEAALRNITCTTDLEEAAREADFIIEAIPEVIELKWDLFSRLAEIIKPDTIVASNTSTFPISRLAENSSFPEQMVITHFFNPAHLVPLVEIVQHPKTRSEVADSAMELIRSIGKSPILLKKEVTGFIGNRLQTALMREAFYLLKEGVASARDIDTAITAGPGFRWAFTGPIEIADFGGLDTWQRVFDNIAPELDESKEAPALIHELAEAGKLGTKTGEGIYSYSQETVSEKLNQQSRDFIKLGKIKANK